MGTKQFYFKIIKEYFQINKLATKQHLISIIRLSQSDIEQFKDFCSNHKREVKEK